MGAVAGYLNGMRLSTVGFDCIMKGTRGWMVKVMGGGWRGGELSSCCPLRSVGGERLGTPASSGGELLANNNSFDESSGEHWVSEEDGEV